MARTKSRSKSQKRKSVSQRGGVAYTFDHNCRVGGLPSRVAISECPKAGPLDSCYIKQLYGQTCNQAGGKSKKQRNKGTKGKKTKGKKTKGKKTKVTKRRK